MQQAREAFTVTLEQMARGGVYDQLAGGFHRYSVDERWVVPHFEKMLYDNTELLRNYVHGYQSFVREDFRKTAEEIIAWLDAVMTDRERGGFYASQDADINLDDDGDYFTWTLDEARAVLDANELAVASRYWDIGELGDMHHNPAKNVLHRKFTVEEVAAQCGRSAEEAVPTYRIGAGQTARSARRASYAIYRSHAVYGLERDGGYGISWRRRASCAQNLARAFALLTLDRLLAEAWDGAESLQHVIAYGEGDARRASESCRHAR